MESSIIYPETRCKTESIDGKLFTFYVQYFQYEDGTVEEYVGCYVVDQRNTQRYQVFQATELEEHIQPWEEFNNEDS